MSELSRVYDRSRVPLYIQVASVMRRRVETGQWLPGQKISTLVELEKEFEVARVTIRQAIDILSDEGLLRSQQGRGTFVADKPTARHWFELATSWDLLVETIKGNVLKRIKTRNPPAFPDLLEGEGKLAGQYTYMRYVQYKDGVPYGVVSLHLADEIFRRAPEQFSNQPALSVLAGMADIVIADAHQRIVIGSADPEASDLLHIALGSPIAECRAVVIDKSGAAIYVANIIYRSDAISLNIDLLANARKRAAAGGSPPADSALARAAPGGVSGCN
jgi:GntR family transcriptional regulator